MSFSSCLGVKILEVNCMPWGATFFESDYHWATPFNWCIVVNGFDDYSFHIMIEAFFDGTFPMMWNRYWWMFATWHDLEFQMQMCWWGSHSWKRCRSIKGTWSKFLQEEVFRLWYVFIWRCKQDFRRLGGGVLFTGSAVFDVGSFYWIAATGWFNGCGNDLWRIWTSIHAVLLR